MSVNLGKVLLIANPAAQNGSGAAVASCAEKELKKALGMQVTIKFTQGTRHGLAIAAASRNYDTVVALGGDGLVHEVVNGLMRIPKTERPMFGLLPAGSGNDYARTLGMSFAVEEAVAQLLEASPVDYDLGCCDGEYFAESLSFGLDAAIALDTVERRKRTGKTGTPLFLESGIDVLLHRMRSYEYEVSLDGWPPVEGSMFLFAVQIGETYGGGFRICPQAIPDDGLLDICVAHPPLSIPKAVMIFLLAKNAHHTKFKQLEFTRASTIEITFKEESPTQIDGEPFQGTKHRITCERRALKVLKASSLD